MAEISAEELMGLEKEETEYLVVEEELNKEGESSVGTDTKELVNTERKSRKRKARATNLPPKGTKEYKERKNAEAKRRRIENAETHRCPFCSFTAPFPSKVKIHVDTNHRKGRHECDLCPMVFDTQGERRRHSAAVHPVIHTCEHCGYVGKKPCDVRKHIYLNHEKGIKCTIPGCTTTVAKWFLKRHLLQVHENSSVALRPRLRPKIGRTTCTECDFATADAEEMNDHYERVHSGEGIDCPHGCGEKLMLAELKDHLERVHDDSSPDRELSVSLSEESGYIDDSRISSGSSSAENKPLEMTPKRTPALRNSCDQKLTPSRLKSILRTRPVAEVASTSSPTSSKTTSGFLDPGELSDSLSEASDDDGDDSRISSGSSSAENKPPKMTPKRTPALRNSCGSFTCEVCGSNYDTLYLLKKHVKRTHERAYSESRTPRVYPRLPCTVKGCGKVFRSSGGLRDHLNAHNNVFPFHCDHCRQSFHSRARFAVHLTKYHHTSIRIHNALRRDLPTSSENTA